MHILFIASRFPWPLTQGDRLRAYHQLRLLSQRHEISLLSPAPDANAAECTRALEPFCAKIVAVAMPKWQRLWQLSQFPLTDLPLQTLYTYNPQLRLRAEQLLRQERFDLAHVQLMRMAPAAVGLQAVPKVIDFIDALSLNMRRRAEREAWYRAWLFRWEGRRAQVYEQKLLTQYHQAIVSTQLDYQALGSHPRIHVATNGVDPGRAWVAEGREANVIAFTGHISYFPNADAAIWFANQVLPLVKPDAPEARFQIIGANPPPAVQQLTQQPDVEVTGYVPSIVDYLQKATIAVAPMQCGSGIQNKVLEAMACGAPLVVTPFALGGLEVTHGEHLLIADNAADFADCVRQLLQDAPLRQKLAANARRLIDERYSWEQSVARLEIAYEQAVQEFKEGLTPQAAKAGWGKPGMPIGAEFQINNGATLQVRVSENVSRHDNGRSLYLFWKRLLDLLAALPGLSLMLALCPLLWLLNWLTSPGSLFYAQERVGLDERPFRMFKFRSMVMTAEANSGPVWTGIDDPRITPVGRILRKSRLDELPQFINILRGEMSLIGPRPERPEFVESLSETIPHFGARHAVKPGITGWAQVNYRYVASVDDTVIKLLYDLEYIERQGIWIDLLILLKTVWVILRLQGQ